MMMMLVLCVVVVPFFPFSVFPSAYAAAGDNEDTVRGATNLILETLLREKGITFKSVTLHGNWQKPTGATVTRTNNDRFVATAHYDDDGGGKYWTFSASELPKK
jgi:hypothetical protein